MSTSDDEDDTDFLLSGNQNGSQAPQGKRVGTIQFSSKASTYSAQTGTQLGFDFQSSHKQPVFDDRRSAQGTMSLRGTEIKDDPFRVVRITDAGFRDAYSNKEKFKEMYKKFSDPWFEKNRTQDKMTKENLEMEGQILDSQLSHAHNLKTFHNSVYIPTNANQLNSKHIWVSAEKNGAAKKNALKPFLCTVKDAPMGGQTVFGSTTAYAQGISLPILQIPSGRLDNVLIFEVVLSDFFNNEPFPVGVTIYHVDEKQLIPLKGARHYGAITNSSGKNFHYIIPPFCRSSQDKTVYMSDRSINSEFSQRFPDITAKETDIRRGVKPYISDLLVPIEHPISQWIFDNIWMYPNWPIPFQPPSDYAETMGKFVVNIDVFEFAVKKVKQLIRETLPIVDLNTLQFHFEYVDPNPQWEREQEDRRLIDNTLSKKSDTPIAVAFDAKIVYMFREVLAPGSNHTLDFDLVNDPVFEEASNFGNSFAL